MNYRKKVSKGEKVENWGGDKGNPAMFPYSIYKSKIGGF